MAKYFANYSINNGTSLSRGLFGNSKSQLKKTIVSLVKDSIFSGSTGKFYISESETGRKVISGYVDASKRVHYLEGE
jgi:hypothetical protein